MVFMGVYGRPALYVEMRTAYLGDSRVTPAHVFWSWGWFQFAACASQTFMLMEETLERVLVMVTCKIGLGSRQPQAEGCFKTGFFLVS